MLFAIDNLASGMTKQLLPWEYTPSIPGEVLSKAQLLEWATKPTTQHCFFSTTEGVNQAIRVTTENHPYLMHGFVADYDALVAPSDFITLPKRAKSEHLPAWGSITFSNQGRLVWLFEEPVLVGSLDLAKRFIEQVIKRLKCNSLLAGFDTVCATDPMHYYEVGRSWVPIKPDARIPKIVTDHWLYEAGKHSNFGESGAPEIPVHLVETEVHRKFPGRWQGRFELGARGVRFWDPVADNPTGAVVREKGMQCFTGPQAFVTWREIFGSEFVTRFEAERTSAIIQGTYYDGQQYWRRDISEVAWNCWNKSDFALYLRTNHGLNSKPMRGETASEVDRVLQAVHDQNRIEAALPLVHYPPGIYTVSGQRFINVSRIQPMNPFGEPVTWGQGFPWLANFIDNFFDPLEQRDWFLAWLAWFYGNALKRTPKRGQAVYICGEPDAGKTLLSTFIVARLVGGYMDASEFLASGGNVRFTDSLLEAPLWAVDDTLAAADPKTHTRYSALVKRMVANPKFTYEAKFKKAGIVEWTGRIIVTFNADPESLRILPSVELNIKDKISLFRARVLEKSYPKDLINHLQQELPFFARYLADARIPEEMVGTARFGVKPYHERSLMQAAMQADTPYAFEEILTFFLTECMFSANSDYTTQGYWEGSTIQLLSLMVSHPEMEVIIRPYASARALAQQLDAQVSRGNPFLEKIPVTSGNTTSRVWRLRRPPRLPAPQ